MRLSRRILLIRNRLHSASLALIVLPGLLCAQPVPGRVPETPDGVNPGSSVMKDPVDWGKIEVFRIIGGSKVPLGPNKPLSRKERRLRWAADPWASDGASMRPFFLDIPDSTEAALQAMLHHEPRYVPCNC